MIYSMMSTNTTVVAETITSPVRMTNNEFEANLAEVTKLFGGWSLSEQTETPKPQAELAPTSQSLEEHDSSTVRATGSGKPQTEAPIASSHLVTSESMLATIAEWDKIEADMMATGADLFAGGSSSSHDENAQSTKPQQAILAVPPQRDEQWESSMTEIASEFSHLSIICHVMEEDEDEMEIDLPFCQIEENEICMAEPWDEESMEIDDPNDEDIDWMELL